MVAMVIGMTSATGQIKGVENYLPTDNDETILMNDLKALDVRTGLYSYGIDKSPWAGADYERITFEELDLVMDEVERILKANEMTLEDYDRVVVNDEVVTKHFRLNSEEIYKMYSKKRWTDATYIFEVNDFSIIFTIGEKEVRVAFGSEESWNSIQN